MCLNTFGLRQTKDWVETCHWSAPGGIDLEQGTGLPAVPTANGETGVDKGRKRVQA
jgi:hypothetical protein